jgi:Cu(I)/Ag(I) efflux system periplasmic protein CusF
MNSLAKTAVAAILALSSAPFALAQAAQPASATRGSSGTGSPASTRTSDSAASMSEGEIKKVDKEAGKVTIEHGPLRNLDMPAMTMIFRVKDPAMLDRIKAGDRISFVADKVGGRLTVTQVEVKQLSRWRELATTPPENSS